MTPIILILLVVLLLAPAAEAATWYVKASGASTTGPADSCASADVQAAITAASDGDTVQLGGGSCTWTSPVSVLYSAGSPVYSGAGTAKYVVVQGAGTMPLHGAATNGGTTITDNVLSGSPPYNMILLVESSAGSVTLANLTINLPDGYSKFSNIGWEPGPVNPGVAGAKVLIMHHVTVNDDRTDATAEHQIIRASTGRGLMYRNKFLRPFVFNGYAVFRCGMAGGYAAPFWQTPTTMGTLDTGADLSLYFLDNIAQNYAETSTDAGCRTVYAFNDLTNFGLGGHGRDSQSPGSRQENSFGNNFNCSGSTAVLGTPLQLRGAVQYHHDNRFDVFDLRCTNNAINGHIATGVWIIRDRPGTGCYLDSGGNFKTYPAIQQFGWGYKTGSTSIDRYGYDQAAPSTHIAADPLNPYLQDLDPSRVWNNYLKDGVTKSSSDGVAADGGIGLANASDGTCNSGQTSADYIAENREWYKQSDSFDGTNGIGIGQRATRPATCTLNTAWWATDQGTPKTSATTGITVSGVLDICTATNTWTNAAYVPLYPHPLATETGTDTSQAPVGATGTTSWKGNILIR